MTPPALILLVSKSVSGDREAFEQLLDSQHPTILYIIRGMTDCPEDAKDIHQEVSVRLYEKINSLKKPEAFCKWLRVLVKRECIRHLASRKRCVSIETIDEWETLLVETDSELNPFARLERLELGSALESALESLHKPILDIFHMRYSKEMRCSDIADTTGEKAGTVSVKLFRAKEHLRKMLQGGIVDTG